MIEDRENSVRPMTGEEIVCGVVAIAIVAVLFLVVMWFVAPYLDGIETLLPR